MRAERMLELSPLVTAAKALASRIPAASRWSRSKSKPSTTRPLKRVVVGRPIATRDQEHQRLPKKIALATFSSDAISSTAYATEEILFVAAVGGSSLALGLDHLIPI